jgi:hypothetical protein
MSNSTHGTGCWTNVLLRAAALGSALLIAMPVARTAAQTVPVLGYVANENADPKRMAALKKGLTNLGYIEGQTLKIEYRSAKLDHEYDAVMAELLSRKVTIILAGNAPAAAAARATRTVPVVLGAVNDPVGLGVADSLERPGRNVTGTTIYAPHLIGGRLRILKAIIPALDRVSPGRRSDFARCGPPRRLLPRRRLRGQDPPQGQSRRATDRATHRAHLQREPLGTEGHRSDAAQGDRDRVTEWLP